MSLRWFYYDYEYNGLKVNLTKEIGEKNMRNFDFEFILKYRNYYMERCRLDE